MRKLIMITFTSTIIALMCSNLLLAQESKANYLDKKITKKYIIGLKIGYNIVNSSNNFSLSEIELVNKMSLGAYLNYSLNDNFSVQPEILYFNKGWKETITIVDDSTNVLGVANGKMNLSYIEVPLLIKYSTKKTRNLSLYLAPTFAYILSAEYTSSGYWNDYTVDTKKLFKNYDLEIGFGLDYSFSVRNKNVNIDVRFTKGMSDIYI